MLALSMECYGFCHWISYGCDRAWAFENLNSCVDALRLNHDVAHSVLFVAKHHSVFNARIFIYVYP